MPRGRKVGSGRPLAERFWKRVDRVERPDACWLWKGTKTRLGYGQIGADAQPGIYRPAVLYAHRVAWELANGPIPTGLFVCHRCDTPGCVRPDHLFLGTQTDNMRDAAKKGRIRNHLSPPKKRTP